jgi:hypothetical protein
MPLTKKFIHLSHNYSFYKEFPFTILHSLLNYQKQQKMKKLKVLAMTLMVTFSATTFAQGNEGKKIGSFDEGHSLSNDDIGFIDLAINGTDSKHRGAPSAKDVTVAKKTFKAGDKITKEDAKLITDAIKAYTEKNKDVVTKDAKDSGSKSRDYYCYYYYGGYYYWYCC